MRRSEGGCECVATGIGSAVMLGLPGLVSAACSIGRPNTKLGPAFPRYGLLVAASPIWAAAQRKIAASLSGFDPTGTRRAVHLERVYFKRFFSSLATWVMAARTSGTAAIGLSNPQSWIRPL